MKEINEIIEYLQREVAFQKSTRVDKHINIVRVQNQLNNANKVAAKLQRAIDLFKEIEEL
jgi:hypothetical protein